ncbi:hypothetical protein AU15_17130 [Marinobacter salarius]|jgi:hypothetical protein|uniref:Uncharacterized protein n=1 Tax=Marinobacter salarius TaxID=1420917 RepID=W5Z4D5_9GAMM|nr:hypothetical protein AU15_17130 [Marinobacter salarius]
MSLLDHLLPYDFSPLTVLSAEEVRHDLVALIQEDS